MHSPSPSCFDALGGVLAAGRLEAASRLDATAPRRHASGRAWSAGHVEAAGRRQHAGRSVRGVGLSRTRAAHADARQSAGVRRRQPELHELSSRRRAARRTRRRSSARSRDSRSTWIAAAPSCRSRIASTTASRAASPDRSCRRDSREMQDIVAYLAFISKGVPNGEHVRGEGMAKMPELVGDSTRGRALFVDNCARCHGSDGAGMGPIPGAVGAEVVQHRRIDGAPGARRVVHSPQHAVRSSGHAHRPAGVRHRRVHHVDAAPRFAGQGERLAERRRAGRRSVRHEGTQGIPATESPAAHDQCRRRRSSPAPASVLTASKLTRSWTNAS